MWRLVSHTEPTLYPFCTPRIKIPNKPYIIPRGSITEAKKSLVPHSFFSLSHHPNTFFIPFSFSLNSATTISNNIAMPSMKTSSSKTSESSTQFDSPHSPLRSFPLFDNADPFHSPQNDNSRAIVIVETTSTQFAQAAPPAPESEHRNPPPEAVVTRPVWPETKSSATVGRTRPRPVAPPSSVVPKREMMAKKVALGFRLSEVVLCLISFSVMAADKTRGWSGDSFDRYKEYRFKVFSSFFFLLIFLFLFCLKLFFFYTTCVVESRFYLLRLLY